jgi:hypothetical protein
MIKSRITNSKLVNLIRFLFDYFLELKQKEIEINRNTVSDLITSMDKDIYSANKENLIDELHSASISLCIFNLKFRSKIRANTPKLLPKKKMHRNRRKF